MDGVAAAIQLGAVVLIINAIAILIEIACITVPSLQD